MSEAGLSAALAAAGGEGGGEGGDAAAAAAAAAAAGAGGEGDDGGADGGGEGGDPWYASLPDDDRKWVENKKFAEPASAVKAYRELEKQFLSGDKIVLPGKDASPEEIDAFHAKIGRPEAPDKYEIKAPEGAKLDDALVEKFRKTAFEAGLPAQMATPLVEMFNEHVTETLQAQEAARAQASKEGVDAMRKEWGAQAPQQLAAANRAMKTLGLTADDVQAMGDALPPETDDQGNVVRNGTARTLALMAKLGLGMGEDILSGGGGQRKFGLSPAEAQAKLDAMRDDPEQAKKLLAGDKQLTAYRAQMMEIVAAGEEAEKNKG